MQRQCTLGGLPVHVYLSASTKYPDYSDMSQISHCLIVVYP